MAAETANCPACKRDEPVFDVNVREGARKQFGLHSNSDGHFCWMSDHILDPAHVHQGERASRIDDRKNNA